MTTEKEKKKKKGTTATTTIFTLGAPLSAVSYRQLSYWTGLKLSSSEATCWDRHLHVFSLTPSFFQFWPPLTTTNSSGGPFFTTTTSTPFKFKLKLSVFSLSLGDCAAVWIFILVRHFSRPWNEISSNICAGFQLHLLPWFGSPFKEERGEKATTSCGDCHLKFGLWSSWPWWAPNGADWLTDQLLHSISRRGQFSTATLQTTRNTLFFHSVLVFFPANYIGTSSSCACLPIQQKVYGGEFFFCFFSRGRRIILTNWVP